MVLTGEAPGERHTGDFVRAMYACEGVVPWTLDTHGCPTTEDLRDVDAVFVYLPFKRLRHMGPLRPRGDNSLWIQFEEDINQNFSAMGPTSPHHGAWPAEFRRHGFDLMLVTGSSFVVRLGAEGIPAAYLPKGFEPARFRPLGLQRTGIGWFGTRYPARARMARELHRAQVGLRRIEAPYSALNLRLNEVEAIVVCNMAADLRWGPAGAAVRRRLPWLGVRVRRGPEPMLKNFESAGAGCAVFMDDVDDLTALGFRHRATAFVYSSSEELIDLLRSTSAEELRAVGDAAADLVHARHTWSHRAAEVMAIVASRLHH